MTEAAPELLASNWVFPGNLRPLAAYLSYLVGYRFDDADWVAIEFGLENSDCESGLWFTYPLEGAPTIELALAAEPEADPVHVQLRSDEVVEPELLIRIETTLSIFNCLDVG